MDKIKIEKNVPMPSRQRAGKWQEIAAKMKPGDSVLVSNGTKKNGLFAAIKQSGGLAISRREGDSYRVWRKK